MRLGRRARRGARRARRCGHALAAANSTHSRTHYTHTLTRTLHTNATYTTRAHNQPINQQDQLSLLMEVADVSGDGLIDYNEVRD